ncbi:pyridoxamine 5'-phosphate oxidase family protein [Konateibacter massiliensis]|uniref:pyridoxamine 5'-phosphate oxidase family protein n=1 Tax=Konateibacter massiliensis TaxID=2002841 RepID=UPI000C152DC4|nr:pyridoxamine 5'-phosphate oxidase family protein [Konateibacter massiliensis]
MDIFKEKFQAFLEEFGKGRKMVLSTSENDKVTSRMMSVVQLDGIFYFQTDKMLRKYKQILNNPNVALCIDNIQIEGVCKELGHPLDNSNFCNSFKECFQGSYNAYTSLDNERLFMVTPTYIERWVYKGSAPYMEMMDVEKESYLIEEYKGI